MHCGESLTERAPNAGAPLSVQPTARGLAPTPATRPPRVGLTPGMPAREAVRRMALQMLRQARQQEAGVLDDLDTEFLHHYRVCLRKTRSLLTLIQHVLPEPETDLLKKALRTLSRTTNRLRDLDVQLNEGAHYASLLPVALHPGLALMMHALREERKRALADVRRRLHSPAYQKRIEQLQTLLETADTLPPSLRGADPIGPLVAEAVITRYQRIRRARRRLPRAAPDPKLHRIRLQGKKLRYLLELFGELVDPQRLRHPLKRLKRLQNSLGDFNDTRVQQARVLAYWRELEGVAPAEQALAVGGLITALHTQHNAQKKRVLNALARFSAPRVHKEVRALVAPLNRAALPAETATQLPHPGDPVSTPRAPSR